MQLLPGKCIAFQSIVSHPPKPGHPGSMYSNLSTCSSRATDDSTQQPRKRGRPPVVDAAKDRLIQNAMQRRGTTNARIIQDELAQAHSVQLSYEAIRKRVKQLRLQTPSAETGAQTATNASEAAGDGRAVQASNRRPSDDGATAAGLVREAVTTDVGKHYRIARDLNMLAETVRTIVRSVPDRDESDVSDDDQYNDTGPMLAEGEVDEASEVGRAAPGSVASVPNVPPSRESHSASVVDEGPHEALSLDIRQRVAATSTAGRTSMQISEELRMPAASMQTTIRNAKRTGVAVPVQRAGRPRVTTETLEQSIYDVVRSQPTASAREVHRELVLRTPVEASFETIRRRVRDAKKQLREERTEATSSGDDEAKAPATTDDAYSAAAARPPASEHSTGVRAAETAPPPSERRRKYGEYSTEVREACVRKHEQDGLTYATIARELGIPHDTVRAIVRKAKKTGSVRTAPRSGRPRKTSDIVDKVILQAVKANHRCTAKMIQEDLLTKFNVQVSCETVRRRVKANTKQRLTSERAELPTVSTTEDCAAPREPTVVFPPSRVRIAVLHTSTSSASMPFPESFSHAAAAGGVASLSALHSILNFHDRQPSEHAPAHGTAIDATTVQGDDSGFPVALAVHEAVPDDEVGVDLIESSSSTRRKRTDYSVEVREQCVAMHAQGHGYRRIGQELSMPHTTVRAICEKAHRTGTVFPAARSGRPRKTDDIVDRLILEVVRKSEKSSARMIQDELQTAYGVNVSCEIIRRRVKNHSRQRHSADLGTPSPSLASSDAIEASETSRTSPVAEAADYAPDGFEAYTTPAVDTSMPHPRSFQEELYSNHHHELGSL